MITANTFTIIFGVALLFSGEVKTDDEGGQSNETTSVASQSNGDPISLIQHMYYDNRENLNLKHDVQDLKESVNSLITIIQQLSTNSANIGVKDCKDLYDQGYHESGVYTLNLGTPVSVYCDQVYNGGGWTVIQNRFDGSVNFYKTWTEYRYGFGNPSGEYWLGNEYLHFITNKRPYRIRFELEDFDGNTTWAEYENFVISDESDDFRMNIDVASYTGRAGNSFAYHNNMKFSTWDRDNAYACAEKHIGAWWFYNCLYSNLNGPYLKKPETENRIGIIWHHWKTINYSLKKSTMQIRPMP